MTWKVWCLLNAGSWTSLLSLLLNNLDVPHVIKGTLRGHVLDTSEGRCHFPRGLHCSGQFLTLDKQQTTYDVLPWDDLLAVQSQQLGEIVLYWHLLPQNEMCGPE